MGFATTLAILAVALFVFIVLLQLAHRRYGSEDCQRCHEEQLRKKEVDSRDRDSQSSFDRFNRDRSGFRARSDTSPKDGDPAEEEVVVNPKGWEMYERDGGADDDDDDEATISQEDA